MKLNIANPGTGLQQTIEIDDDKKLLPFYEKRMGVEVPADSLGDKFKGYIFKITGGNDKQGFPMMQGVMTNGRVRLLFSKGMKCYRPRRTGEKKRKTVRGCIVGPDLSVIHVVVTKKGEEEIPGLTDGSVPRRLGPKRANKIRKMWNLSSDDDVRKYVVRRTFTDAKGKTHSKAPKIQRLITESRIQRKGRRRALQRRHWESIAKQESDYKTYLAERKAAATTAGSHGTPSPSAASPAAAPPAAATTPAAAAQ